MPKFHKLQRGICLALFASSSIASYLAPHLILVATLSLIGILCLDVLCYLRDKNNPTDYGPAIDKLQESHDSLTIKVQEIRDDSSIGKLAETFKRNR